jgi:hypothetical protein
MVSLNRQDVHKGWAQPRAGHGQGRRRALRILRRRRPLYGRPGFGDRYPGPPDLVWFEVRKTESHTDGSRVAARAVCGGWHGCLHWTTVDAIRWRQPRGNQHLWCQSAILRAVPAFAPSPMVAQLERTLLMRSGKRARKLIAIRPPTK